MTTLTIGNNCETAGDCLPWLSHLHVSVSFAKATGHWEIKRAKWGERPVPLSHRQSDAWCPLPVLKGMSPTVLCLLQPTLCGLSATADAIREPLASTLKGKKYNKFCTVITWDSARVGVQGDVLDF